MATGYTPGVISSSSKSGFFDSKNPHSLVEGRNLSHSGAQVQNVKAARVYVFGDGNLAEDEDDEVTEFEMRSRHHKNVSSVPKEDQKPIFFETVISEGDTLQAIALKYACNVSELKRLNNLIQDQDFFALKVLKIPMKRHGILSEKVARNELGQVEHSIKSRNGSTSFCRFEDDDDGGDPYSENESQHDFSDPETQMKVLRTLSIRENFSSQGKEAEKFLNKMDADLTKFKKKSRSDRESLTEVISVLTNKTFHPLSTSSKDITNYSGADCGVSWKSILIIMLVIAIVVPLLYLLYYLFLVEDKKND